MVGADLLLLPNCNPITTPDQDPAVLKPGQSQHGFSIHGQGGDSRNTEGMETFIADWTYAYRRGVGNGLDLGLKVTEGLFFIIPSGAQLDVKYQLPGMPFPVSADMAVGLHGGDFWSRTDGNLGTETLTLTPSLMLGHPRFYGGLRLDILDSPGGSDSPRYLPGLTLGTALGKNHQLAPEAVLYWNRGGPGFMAGLSWRWKHGG